MLRKGGDREDRVNRVSRLPPEAGKVAHSHTGGSISVKASPTLSWKIREAWLGIIFLLVSEESIIAFERMTEIRRVLQSLVIVS